MTNPLKIYSGSNALLYTTPINTGCRRRVQLMNEDSITVKFSDKTKMKFPVGTRIGDFYITKEQQEKYNATTGGYDYELKFDAYYWLWANRLLFYVMPGVTNAPKETSFKLTATIDVHAAVILRALNALGFTYNGSPFRVDTDEGFSTEAKYISYANMSVLGGIQAIADAYECEWWVVGNSIHFGKCNAIGEYDFTVGENVASITSDAKTTPANRLVVFGSTRNLPPNYRTPESSDVVDAVVVKRLMLPEGTPYLQTSPDIPEDEIVEEEVVLDSVYPRTSLTVTDVETYDSTNDGMTQTFYRIKYGTAFHFSKDYILPDEELHVVFESGDLNGMDFAVKFNPLGLAEKKDDGSFNPEAQMFEIVANEDYGRSLPDAVLHPAKTDKFSLYGWDSTKMEALGLLAAAEQELLTEGNKLLDEYRKDKQTYTCPMMWDWCKEQAEEGNSPRLGSVVNLHFVAGDTGRKSRIIGYEHDLDIEYSNVTYICGEKVSVSRLKTLESKVEGLTHDGTKVKVQNSLDFLSKRYSDRTPYQLASDMGFDVGQFLASVSGGRFGIDKVTGQSFLEVDRIFARVRAYFESLTVVERESLAGEQMVTPGGGVKCTSVEEVRNGQNVLTGWRCYFLSEQDGEKRETKIIVGDQAIAQTFNAKAGTTNKVSNHRWWRLVTGVSNNAYTDDSGNIYGYIEVSKSDCETDSDTPKEGDEIVQFGNRTDKTRQAAILISTVATDAPSIKLLTGIDHYSLVGKDIISQGYDAAKGHAYFRCYGDTYIGAPDGSTYVKYDVDSKKLTVKADLEVGSTIGGKDAEDFVKDLIPEIPELTQEDIEDFVNNIVDPKIEGIQDQIDGVVESFFGFGAPTLSNYPANEWTTDELRKAHERDTYTDKTEYVDDVTTPTAGMSWKWQYTSPTDYGWVKIADSDATRALLDAARAQDTADGKRRTFTAQPVPPYDKGDIWVNATYPAGNTVKDAASGKYHNDILRCNTSRATGSFAIGDWGLASNYTDDTAALAAAAAAQAAKNAADAAQSAANAAQSSVTSLNDYVNGAFKDGIIDETEASGIANYINIVNADKERIDGTYQTLYANAYLSATGKAALKTAHDDVAAKITALISAINSAIADNKVTAAESAAVNSAFSAFSTSNKAFSSAVETANEEIQQTLKSAADAAKTAADNAKAAADAAKGVADAAKDRLDSWAADGVISPTEKQAIKDEIARIDADKAHIAAEYTRYSLGTPTDYNAAHSAYRAQLVTLSASTPESITIPPYFSANQTAYYNQRTAALSAIATAAKKYADDVAKEEAKKATDVYKYLKESLLNAQQESTEISGGLILSTMMALGYTENGVKKILSGMNGSYVSSLGGRTIASWYGGHMLDLFDKNDSRIANPTGQEATSLIRMDGSFYFANGNIGGRTDGSGWLAGNNITWDASGAITFGNGIHIDLGSGNSTTLGGLNSKLSGVETTVGSVLTLVNALSNVLVPVNSSGTRVAWDSADLFAVKSVKGFYSEEFVSARGMSGQSSSISKYLTDLLDVGISAPSSGQALVYNGSKWVNQAIQTGLDETALASYLTTNNYAKKSDIPSLTGYVTLDTAQTITATKTFSTAIVNSLDNQNSWWVSTAVRGKFIATNGGSKSGWSPVLGFKTVTGKYEIGSLNDTGYINYYHDTRTTNGADYQLTIPKATGTLATQEWVTGAYVKKAGDTMTGVLNINANVNTSLFVLNQTAGKEPYLYLQRSGVNKAAFTHHPVYGASIFSAEANKYLGITDAGVPNFYGSTIWHAGNDGSGSGLDADLLDGVHNGEVTAKKLTVVTTATIGVTVATAKTNMLNAIKGSAFGNVAQVGSDLIANWSNDSHITVDSSVYSVINVTPQYDGNSYGQYLLFHYASHNPKLIGRNKGAWTAIKTFAFLDDTVANANSLGGKAASQYVTTDTAQTISGAKTFSNGFILNTDTSWPDSDRSIPFGVHGTPSTIRFYWVDANKGLTFNPSTGTLKAASFVKRGGTSSQVLMADGSVQTHWKSADVTSATSDVGMITPLAMNNWVSNNFYKKADADSRFVNVSGDTMTGVLTINSATRQVLLLGGATNGNYMSFKNGSTIRGHVGRTDDATFLQNNDANGVASVLKINDSQNLIFAPNGTYFTVWHAGNDGSGSGLDADLLDGYHLDSVRGYRVYHSSINSALSVGYIPFNAFGMQHGYPVYNDPEFASGYNYVDIYNNAGNGNVTLTRIADSQASANSSGYILQIQTKGAASPTHGGFKLNINSRANAVFMQIFRAKIPSGYTLNVASNKMGDNYSDVWLTANAGTGKWEWYARMVYCGSSGTFSIGGHIYLSGGPTPTASAPITWYLSHCQVWDLTKNNYGAFRAKFADALSTARTLWGQSFNGSGNVSGNISGCPRIYNAASNNMYLGNSDNTGWVLTQNICSHSSAGDTYWSLRSNGTLHCKKALVGTTTASYALNAASFICDSWIRSQGASGWYNETYGGGWYMTDSAWIKNYNGKKLQILGNTDYNAILVASGGGITVTDYAGSSWNTGIAALNVGVTNNSGQTPLLLAYRKGNGYPISGGANRLFALELLNSGTSLHFGFGGASKFEMSSTGVFHAIGGIYSDGYVSARGQNTSSDKRLKNILRPLSLNVRDIANAPSVEFIWRKDGIKDVGSIAQYWKRLIPQLAPEMPDGSMGLQYGKTALMSVIAVAKKTVSLEERITQLESENRELKAQISQLKTQLA